MLYGWIVVMQMLQNNLSETLDNIKMSCQMEGLTLTDEIRSLCLSIANGSRSLQECLDLLNAKYI